MCYVRSYIVMFNGVMYLHQALVAKCTLHFWSFWMWRVGHMVSILGGKSTTTHPLVSENNSHNFTGYGHCSGWLLLQRCDIMPSQSLCFETETSQSVSITNCDDQWEIIMFSGLSFKNLWSHINMCYFALPNGEFDSSKLSGIPNSVSIHKTFSLPTCPHQAQCPNQSSNQGSLPGCKGVTVQGWPLTSI